MKSSETAGIVFLVGAGPGDPGLITVRGARLLEQADVVVYDYLSNPRLLNYCPRAEVIYVGKKAAAHSMPQEQINCAAGREGPGWETRGEIEGGRPVRLRARRRGMSGAG